ncbi:unnamed protein product [Effrenium voratum]|uniref:Uncharacterized protein n=1 Tax=Effrenium voratum TaxID=2562239 RepID=A0AA36JQ19_9DINO|nr:unnamed protein product [Effrenium voratum]CAJ1409646.1 unnamed protein product [Effrenium voratum]CAJ1455324.1 unnamed protein product [Effrenium voratum]
MTDASCRCQFLLNHSSKRDVFITRSVAVAATKWRGPSTKSSEGRRWMHRRARFRDDLGLNCRQLCISGSAPALQVGGSSRASTPAKAKRRSGAAHAGLVGQLSSTFAAPLEECSTLENLHRVALQISGRLSSHRLAFAALVAAVSGRCASMLRRGWSMEEAADAMPLLADLWHAGLLYVPGDTARTAVASALATLVSGGRKETPPGSALGFSRPSSTGSGVPARETMEQRLRRWCRSGELFESAASMELLTREGAALVEEQLYEELKRTLAGAREEDLRKAASKVKLGSVPLARACGLMAKARARPGKPSNQVSGPSEAEAEAAKVASEATAETVAAIVFEVVRNTETASGERATSARAALEENGFVEGPGIQDRLLASTRSPSSSRYSSFYGPLESGPSCSPPASIYKSRDEGSLVLPDFDGPSVSHGDHLTAAARKANTQLTALEGGLLRLEAARQEMRRAKALHPLPRMQAVGFSVG